MTTEVSTDVIEDDAVTTAKIPDNAVTTAKIADDAVSGAKIAMGSDAVGDILYYNGTDYVRLAKGTGNQALVMNNGATAPEWATISREMFIPISSTGVSGTGYGAIVGEFPTSERANGAVINFVFKIPDDFVSLIEAVILNIPDATETIQIDVATDFGQADEAYNNHSGSLTDDQASATQFQLLEHDVSGALTGITAGDYVGMKVTSNTTQLDLVGLQIKYVAAM